VLEELIGKVRALDMDEVRREIEKRKKEQEPRA
jgi:thioredoxin 1